jgi:vacuolar iron transporter family protein
VSYAARPTRSRRRELRRIVGNFRSECDSAELYQALAGIERSSSLGAAFQQLAKQEREHAAIWEQKLRLHDIAVPKPIASLRTRLLAGVARSFGVQFVIPWITARELRDRYRYAQQADAAAAGLAQKEHEHALAMRLIGTEAAALMGSAAALQNGLRAAVLAATDGLTSDFCLLMGVAGGGADRRTILLTGVAGLIAGACSMALGEWLSLTNARELAGSEIDRELERLERRSKRSVAGASTAVSASTDSQSTDRPESHRLHLEPGISQSHWTARPIIAATVSFGLFAFGALIALLPFFWTSSKIVCIVCALAALFALGLMTSFFNGRDALYSGFRQLGIGAAAAALTYGVGWLFGAIG